MNNKNKLYEFFAKNFPFNKDGLNELIDSFEEKYYKKKEIILNAQSIEQNLSQEDI